MAALARKLGAGSQEAAAAALADKHGQPPVTPSSAEGNWQLAAGRAGGTAAPDSELQQLRQALEQAWEQEDSLQQQVWRSCLFWGWPGSLRQRWLVPSVSLAGGVATPCTPSFPPGPSVVLLQILQLREHAIQVEARSASLQADLATAQASAGDAATAAAAVGDLRRQLEERSKEVAELSALSLKVRRVLQRSNLYLSELLALRIRISMQTW